MHGSAFSRASAFDNFAREHPELEHKLLERTLSELDRARNWMLLLGRKSAGERVATFLLEMAQRLADSNPAGRGGGGRALRPAIEPPADGRPARPHHRDGEPPVHPPAPGGIIDLPDRRAVVILDRAAMEAEAGNG